MSDDAACISAMPKVVFILGLCGSGKSTRAKVLEARGFVNFDEKATGRPMHPDLEVWPTSAYRQFLETVAAGRDCVVTEIFFYRRDAQPLVMRDVSGLRPDAVVEWECFNHADLEIANYNCEHDPDRTAEGIRANLAQNQDTIVALRNGTYELPSGHAVLTTVRASSPVLSKRICAGAGDLRRLYVLLEEASAWLAARGVAQWNPVYPFARFAREVERGDVWYWLGDGEIVAMATLLPSRPEYYPDDLWHDAARAWYLCRFAVSRKLSGRSVGDRVLREIESDAAGEGIDALRLDIVANNPFLAEYYSARGFTRVATLAMHGQPSIFFEKVLAMSAR